MPRTSARRPALRGSGKQGRLHQLAGHQPLQRGEVLLGERLRRRHQGRLRAVLDRPQHRVQRHDGLARADLAHQQALHGAALREVRVDQGDRPALVAGRRERQGALEPARAELGRLVELVGARVRAAARAPAQQRQLRQQELLEGQPPPARLVLAEVCGAQRPGAIGQALAGAQARGQRLADVAQRGAVLAHEREDLRRAQSLGGGIGRDLARRAERLAGRRVRGDAEAVARLVLAVEHQSRARPVLALEPRLVEERRRHRAGGVRHHRLDERAHAAAADRARRDRAHLDDDGGGLAGHELVDRPGFAAVARQVLEQIADGVQAEPLRPPGRGRGADLERRGQARGPRIARRAGGRELRALERLGGGKRGRRHALMMTGAAAQAGRAAGFTGSGQRRAGRRRGWATSHARRHART